VNLVAAYFRELAAASVSGWNRFWFRPRDVATVAVIRICCGAMLFYTHLVWTKELDAFFGNDGFVPPDAARSFYEGIGSSWHYAVSYLWFVRSPAALYALHYAGLAVLAMFTLGLFTRVTAVLSLVVALSYVNRVPGTLFGLDQINVMLVSYLMLAPCGAAYSLDRLIAARRRGHDLPPAAPSTAANVATRLIQLHMCIIYFFAGLGKLQGDTWWHGDALWGAAANLEYQTVDLTWLADWPVLTAILSQGTAYWELTFCVLIWPRLTRPLVMFIAIPLHLGIGICMGLMTFGLIMPVGVAAFVEPWLTRRMLECCDAEQRRGGGRPTPVPEPRTAGGDREGEGKRRAKKAS
jgi:hypothetical protein